MNKPELIEHIAHDTDVSKASVARMLESLIKATKKTLARGDEMAIHGFGTFSVAKRAARVGRNPRTGVPANIPASKAPKFKAAKALKDAVN